MEPAQRKVKKGKPREIAGINMLLPQTELTYP